MGRRKYVQCIPAEIGTHIYNTAVYAIAREGRATETCPQQPQPLVWGLCPHTPSQAPYESALFVFADVDLAANW